MERPTLEEQIRISKMTEEELIDYFMPHGFWQTVNFFVFCHAKFLWNLIHWNWYDKYTESYRFAEYFKSIYKKHTR